MNPNPSIKIKQQSRIQHFSIIFLIIFSFFSVTISTIVAAESVSDETSVSNMKDKTVYSSSFFSQYLPQNSLEMVERLPGFNFDPGSNNRGFGGNAGNVLIDGVRPTSKSGGLRGALIRLPAAQVERIEIIRGSSNSEAAGHSIVANVIKKQFGSSGTWAAKLRRAPAGDIQPNIEAAISTNIGDWKASFDTDIGGYPGYRTALIEDRDDKKVLTSSSNEIYSERMQWIFVNAEGSRPLADGRLTLNGRLGGDQWQSKTKRDIFDDRLPDASAADGFKALKEKRIGKMGELGVDWNITQDDWKWRLIGLGIVHDSHYENQYLSEDFVKNSNSNSDFDKDELKTEFIARTTFGKVSDVKFKPEFGIELANNKLKTETHSFQNGIVDEQGTGDVEVNELRAEIFATFVYQLNSRLSIEGGLTSEFSQIKVSGDTTQRQTFQFLKPRISTTYKYSDNTQFTFNLERRVGQLNFSDFAASSQAADNFITSGNPNLAPDTTDEVSAVYDWSISNRGSLKVKLFHQWRSDILEQIILPSGRHGHGHGLGNAGSARFWGVQTDINLPLDSILDNGLLEITHIYQDSTYDDPIINGERTITGYTPNAMNINIRQDLIQYKIAWGVEYWSSFTDTNYFVDQRHTFSGNKRARVFIETSRYFGVKIQLEINNVNTGDFTRSRYIYKDTRGGIFQGSEVARRHRRPELKFSVFGSF